MDQPFFQGISAIQETQAMFSSMYTDTPSMLNNQQNFHSTRMFAIGTLQSWGLQMGDLPYSKSNQTTLKCLLQLISFRQKDLAYRIKAKQDINKVQFQKQKYESLLKQSKRTLQEREKHFGKLENQLVDYKSKIKKTQSALKKQKQDDKKIIAMLKSKNQQVMHEVKKKQSEVTKMKEQMKKGIKQKSVNSSALKGALNLFQVFQTMSPKKGSFNSNQQQISNEQKFNFMINKSQKQKKDLLNQSILLRQKIYDIRQILVEFAEWVDKQLFRIKTTNFKNSFFVNHNLLFSKGALINELNQVVRTAKDGIQQIQNNCAQGVISKKQEPRQKKPSIRQGSSTQRKMFKKKSTSENIIPMQSQNLYSKKSLKQTPNQSRNKSQKSIYTQKSKPMRMQKLCLQQLESKLMLQNQKYQIPSNKQQSYGQEQYFQDQLLSDIQLGDHDNSIVSHISIAQIKNQKNKYDKWDILFKND